MPSPLRIALCLAALFSARVALADDNGNVKVDVVVNMTDEGRKIPRPTPDHPAYYYPVTRGYTPGGAILSDQPPPPPPLEVERLIGKELAKQGYLFAANHPPSLVLLFWWGYKAPEIMGPSGDSIEGGTVGGLPGGASVNGPGLPTNISANHNEMEELVFGSEYAPDPLLNGGSHPSIRLENLNKESRVARYYMMVSALDFKAATQKKPVLLWTARISTSLWSHTLEQVLPTLLAAGGPMLGRDSDGPQITSESVVPMGHVIVGTPVLKSDMQATKPAP
jgi:hypothetical protein